MISQSCVFRSQGIPQICCHLATPQCIRKRFYLQFVLFYGREEDGALPQQRGGVYFFVSCSKQNELTLKNSAVTTAWRDACAKQYVYACAGICRVLSTACEQRDPHSGRCFCWRKHIPGNGTTLSSSSRALKQNWALAPTTRFTGPPDDKTVHRVTKTQTK